MKLNINVLLNCNYDINIEDNIFFEYNIEKFRSQIFLFFCILVKLYQDQHEMNN